MFHIRFLSTFVSAIAAALMVAATYDLFAFVFAGLPATVLAGMFGEPFARLVVVASVLGIGVAAGSAAGRPDDDDGKPAGKGGADVGV